MRATDFDSLVADCVAILRQIVYLPEGAITEQTRLADLGLDSLDMMEAALELEAALGRELPDGAMINARSVGDLAACLAGGAPALSLAA
jgi:acyl carrier protein